MNYNLPVVNNPPDEYIDEYVVGIQNPTQLTSSLALLLREKNYVSLYDTSVLSSPEAHIKKSTFEELNRDFLYKWFLFFTGLRNNLRSYDNLILMPEVAEEMYNLVTATLSYIEKKKNQYKMMPPLQRAQFQDVYEQILNNEKVLLEIHKKVDDCRHTPGDLNETIFNNFLQTIKLLNEHLELKKPSSRGGNDTDERLACRTFYELVMRNRNVAVYTRDDDIRKLISATYKFLVSKEIQDDQGLPFLKNLYYLNIIVLKYNYEKRVFSRFFESSTWLGTAEFRFPYKLGKKEVSQILASAKEQLQKIQIEIDRLAQGQKPTISSKPKEEILTPQVAHQAIERLFADLGILKTNDQDMQNWQVKLHMLDNLTLLTKYFGHNGLQDQIAEMKDRCQRTVLQNVVEQLRQEQGALQKKFDTRSNPPSQGLEYWQQIQTMAEAIRENLCKLNFFENALQHNMHTVTASDYDRFKALLAKCQAQGFLFQDKEVLMPHEKLTDITCMPLHQIIDIIETHGIKHAPTHSNLTQKDLILFLVKT
jgi:hypothetical protein